MRAIMASDQTYSEATVAAVLARFARAYSDLDTRRL